ncbi:uncharacterized protein PV09_01691 [Verruconis gallopava]|uniref:C3H1-type domain-containing protein n=1 Tax=Verruconis gallopava TaxID=253628 RepID=A0A0D2ALW3_9PEZI|nr:uncharacterized protein PV09_01691 [Verruconis gallopava]KIW07763.1 hypothetical protein PV09_01691 [Verruconis gallopava]
MSGFSFPPPPPPPPAPSATGQQAPHGNRADSSSRGARGRGRGISRGSFQRVAYHQQSSVPAQRSQTVAPTSWHQLRSPPEPLNRLGNDGYQNHSVHSQHSQNTSLGYGHQGQIPHGIAIRPGVKRTHKQAFDKGHTKQATQKLESRPKVPAAPAVPSFGFSLPAKASAEQTLIENEQNSSQKKQRKTNFLGLTPRGETRDESDEDVDEEASFAQGSQTISIQHRGRSIELKTAADVAAWIAERKKQYPTQARIAMKKAAQGAAQQKAQGEGSMEEPGHFKGKERTVKAKRKERNPKGEESDKFANNEDHPSQPAFEATNDQGDPRMRIAFLEEQLRQAREALARGSTALTEDTMFQSTAQLVNHRKPETAQESSDISLGEITPLFSTSTSSTKDITKHEESKKVLGLIYSSEDGEPVNSTSESSSEEPSSDSDDSDVDSDSDSDTPPEEISAKANHPINVPPPRRKEPNKAQVCKQFANTGRCKYGEKCTRSHYAVCKYFAKHGRCKYGDKCRLSHDVTPNTGKGGATSRDRTKIMSLRERMFEQEQRKAAELGVLVIKHFGDKGFFQEM